MATSLFPILTPKFSRQKVTYLITENPCICVLYIYSEIGQVARFFFVVKINKIVLLILYDLLQITRENEE
jgi:hypothetical protein